MDGAGVGTIVHFFRDERLKRMRAGVLSGARRRWIDSEHPWCSGRVRRRLLRTRRSTTTLNALPALGCASARGFDIKRIAAVADRVETARIAPPCLGKCLGPLKRLSRPMAVECGGCGRWALAMRDLRRQRSKYLAEASAARRQTICDDAEAAHQFRACPFPPSRLHLSLKFEPHVSRSLDIGVQCMRPQKQKEFYPIINIYQRV